MEFSLPYDWTFLALRLLFVGLIYLFLWQVARVVLRDLNAAAERAAPKRRASALAKLTVVDPAESALDVGLALSVGGRASVGRHPSCDVSIDEPFLSALHAEIGQQHGEWFVSDLDSTNGTFLNGQRIYGQARLSSNDVVQFGRIKLEFAC